MSHICLILAALAGTLQQTKRNYSRVKAIHLESEPWNKRELILARMTSSKKRVFRNKLRNETSNSCHLLGERISSKK